LTISKISSSNIWVISIVAGLGLGLALSYLYFQPQLSSATETEETFREQIADLEEEADDLNNALSKSEEDLLSAEAEVEDLRIRLSDALREKDQAENLLAVTNATLIETSRELDAKKTELKEAQEEVRQEQEQFARLSSQIALTERSLEQLESGKKVLTELRKWLLAESRVDPPITRDEAKEHWENIGILAVELDPSLGKNVNKILSNMEIYFDWLESAPGENVTLEEFVIWFITPPQGAIEYNPSIDEFLSEVYLKMIRDIDAALEAAG
jgi:predicted  nucleic acid-binding Zn-ribbon protein